MSTLTISFEATGEERFNCASSKMTKFSMTYTIENKIEEIYECLKTASNTITSSGNSILQSLIDMSNTYHNDLHETINTISKDLLDNLGKNPLTKSSRRIFSNNEWHVLIDLNDPTEPKVTSAEMFPLKKPDITANYRAPKVVYLSNRSPVALTASIIGYGESKDFRFLGLDSREIDNMFARLDFPFSNNDIMELREYINDFNEKSNYTAELVPIKLGTCHLDKNIDLRIELMSTDEYNDIAKYFGGHDFPKSKPTTNILKAVGVILPDEKAEWDDIAPITFKPYLEIQSTKSTCHVKCGDLETEYLKVGLDNVKVGPTGYSPNVIAESILTDSDYIHIGIDSERRWFLTELRNSPKFKNSNMEDRKMILADLLKDKDLSKEVIDLSFDGFEITLSFKEVKE